MKDGRYAAAGVDIDAGNRMVDLIKPLLRGTARPGADAEIGGFGGLFDLKAAGFSDPILVAATDGVGTKVKIAVETSRHDTIGIDLVAMSVNDLVVQGAEPLFFLDYFACGKLDPEIGAAIVSGIAAACRESGCALIGGETAEMPGVYQHGDYDLAGFAVGAVARDGLLPRKDIAPGDVVIGLASSGVHSNGFSLVRRIVADSGLAWDAPAPFEPARSLGEALLTPTRLYVRSCLAASARRKRSRRSRTSPAADLLKTFRACSREKPRSASTSAAFPSCRFSSGSLRLVASASRRCCARSTAASAWSPCSIASFAGAAIEQFTGHGETVVRLGEVVAGGGAPVVNFRGRLDLSS